MLTARCRNVAKYFVTDQALIKNRIWCQIWYRNGRRQTYYTWDTTRGQFVARSCARPCRVQLECWTGADSQGARREFGRKYSFPRVSLGEPGLQGEMRISKKKFGHVLGHELPQDLPTLKLILGTLDGEQGFDIHFAHAYCVLEVLFQSCNWIICQGCFS